jgi:hypothetical protein
MEQRVATNQERFPKLARNVVSVSFDVKAGWEQWLLLRSDVHHDNPKCNQELEKRHLDEAKKRNALIIDNGDLFCAMQGKYDKRSDKEALRPEHQHGNYLDALVDTTAEFYKPYLDNFCVIGRGNHETHIRKYHETDLTDRLVAIMRANGSPVQSSGYGGWVRFQFVQSKKVLKVLWLWHFHGSGGGGPVTRGTIQTSRIAVFTPDADIVLTGHTHDDWIVPIPRQRITPHGRVFRDEQLHIRAPGYKDAWGDAFGGWETEKMLGPKCMGSVWLRLSWDATASRVITEATRTTGGV